MNSNQCIQYVCIENTCTLFIISSWFWTLKLEHKQNCVTETALVYSLKKNPTWVTMGIPMIDMPVWLHFTLTHFDGIKTLYFQNWIFKKALRMTVQSVLFSVVPVYGIHIYVCNFGELRTIWYLGFILPESA